MHIAEYLKGTGYYTFITRKWHLGSKVNAPHFPLQAKEEDIKNTEASIRRTEMGFESENLSAKYPEIVSSLKKEWSSWAKTNMVLASSFIK